MVTGSISLKRTQSSDSRGTEKHLFFPLVFGFVSALPTQILKESGHPGAEAPLNGKLKD